MFDRILSSNSKEFKEQSAFPTQAIKKFYESDPTDQREVDGVEHCEIQATNKRHSILTSHAPNDSDLDLEPFTGHELDAIGDNVMDQTSAYAEVWTNEVHFILELSRVLGNSRTQWGTIYGLIATLVGFLPIVQHFESRVLEVEDSVSDDDFDHTPRASHNNCPRCFGPVPESDTDSVLADDGSCLSDGPDYHHKALIRNTRPSLRGYGLSTLSGMDHTKHPAFRTRSEKGTTSILADDISCISPDTKAHKEDLFDGSPALGIRANVPSIWADIDQEHPAVYSRVEQDGSNIPRTAGQITREFPALFERDEDDNGGGMIRTATAPNSAIPDSPTLGGNSKRISWYSGSLSRSEEEFLCDEGPTLAPLPFTPLSTDYEGHLSNRLSRSSSSQSHHCTNFDLQGSFTSKGKRYLSPSQPEFHDGGADFVYDDGLEEKFDGTLNNDLDEWFAAGREDVDGTEDHDTMDDGAGEHGFSDAFRSSPFFPSNHRISPRKTTRMEPLRENIVTVGAATATQDFAGALNDDDTGTHNRIATSAREDNSQVCVNSFGTLRAYRGKEVQQVLRSSPPSIPNVPLVVGSPYAAQPITRSKTPTDREVNHYLQRTARPNAQTTSGSSRRTNQSHELDYAVNVTPTLDREISPERNVTFPSTLNYKPRTPLYKTLAQKASLSVITFKDPSPSKSPSTPTTPKTIPTKKKFGLKGSWGRKGRLPTEVRNSPCTLSGSNLKDSPPFGSSSFCRTPLTQTTNSSSQSPRSPLRMTPVTQHHYLSPPQRTAPCTPLDEIPPIPARNPRRLAPTQSSTNMVLHSDSSGLTCNASFPELQRKSMVFFNQLDQNARRFYAAQKVSHRQSSPYQHRSDLRDY